MISSATLRPSVAPVAILILPALPRPPISTCALTTHSSGDSLMNSATACGVCAWCPRGTMMPARLKSSLP